MSQQSETLSISTNNGSVVLAQLSDPHLFTDVDSVFLGINPHASLTEILNVIQNERELNAVLATGDISQDHQDSTYRLFEQMMTTLPVPTFVLPGNHDKPHSMQQAFAGDKVHYGRRVVAGNWQILLLDSTVAGRPSGHLSDNELDWLGRMLQQFGEMPTVVALHHNPVLTECVWLDQHCLANGNQLLAMLALHPQVKAVLWGHVHQQMDLYHQHIRLLAVPSTSIQFKPKQTNFVLDKLQPGYRLLRLYPDGTFDTEVKRLKDGKFIADSSATGY
ncbi:3',5'-cyclic-AMP phosphodiesterase [Ferrimonas senticii]|uniref:3',5'-cyclic-AMP phosphodiesterase n=1 Tax=Ferrimonas senticii TaxID=394566 RepID=UPI0004077683|nr:3',5'-cyclic-AMP phosphodiesterase [Ferrimonas senticii]